jgi:5'-phosphate synthase pdxT subunit
MADVKVGAGYRADAATGSPGAGYRALLERLGWVGRVSRPGVLALQGGFAAHVRALHAAGFPDVREVRTAADLAACDALVLPGGESTAQLRLIDRDGLWAPLDAFVRAGHPVLATCAGLILAARHVTRPAQRSFGWLDVGVARNAWGRQLDSFEAVADDGVTRIVTIRAPRIIERVATVDVLVTYRGEPMLVRQANVAGATYHPELGDGL